MTELQPSDALLELWSGDVEEIRRANLWEMKPLTACGEKQEGPDEP